jgi:hypothetical protein
MGPCARLKRAVSAQESAQALVRTGDLNQAITELVAGGSDQQPLAFAVASTEPEPEPEPEPAPAPAPAREPIFRGDETIERLQERLRHQTATLEMLRAAGASSEELTVLARAREIKP